jgi:hypothetical protein
MIPLFVGGLGPIELILVVVVLGGIVWYVKSEEDRAIGGMGIIGLVLLTGGIAFALYGHQNMSGFETTAGQVGRALSEEARGEYQMFSNMRMGGAVGAAIGAVLSLADIAN